jgi:DinB superfamily
MSQPTRFWSWKDRRLPGGRHFRVGDTSDTPGMAGSMLKPMTTRVAGFRGEFLWELEIAIRQSVELAEAIPPAKYDWRPDTKARSVSEVFVHVATGNFMLLDVIGVAAPMDFYAQVPADGQERFSGLIRRNDELAARVREKNAVVPLLKRSLQAVNQSFNQASDPELDRRLHFFGRRDNCSTGLLTAAGARPRTHGSDDRVSEVQWHRAPVVGLETGSTHAELSCDT